MALALQGPQGHPCPLSPPTILGDIWHQGGCRGQREVALPQPCPPAAPSPPFSSAHLWN